MWRGRRVSRNLSGGGSLGGGGAGLSAGGRLVDGVLTIAASEHRAQLRNRDAARARLAAIVAEALRPPSPTRRATRPSRGAKERRLDEKKRRTDVKQLRRPPHD